MIEKLGISTKKYSLHYPMVEAFYHMKDIPNEAYNSYTASLEECTTVIRQNIDKAWILLETERVVNVITQIIPSASELLKAQLKKTEAEQLPSVLCTCVFYIADYNSNLLMLTNTSAHQNGELRCFLSPPQNPTPLHRRSR